MCMIPVQTSERYSVKDHKMIPSMVVPCGKCPECKTRKANDWIIRIQNEEKIHFNSLFVTLTYSDENLKWSDYHYSTLFKRDVQLFLKRLRKNTKRKHLKYYACGEYGSKTWRPHYHLIMFDVDPNEIDKAWGLGHTVSLPVLDGGVAYVTKYICKDKKVPAYQGDDRLPEFALMSKHLGNTYLTPQMISWHIKNKASYYLDYSGYKKHLPRYYRDKIFNTDEKTLLNYESQLKHSLQIQQQIELAGGTQEYYRQRWEYVRNNNKNYINKQKNQRDKL